MEAQNVVYILRGEQTYETLPDAEQGLKDLVNHVGWNPGVQISYQIKKKRFKAWVPTWLKKLVTK